MRNLNSTHIEVLHAVKQELNLKNDQYELLIAICTQIPTLKLQHLNTSETPRVNKKKKDPVLDKFSAFFKTLNI